MYIVHKPICVLVIIGCVIAATGTTAQESNTSEPVTANVAGAATDTAISVEKECTDANGAGVCWLIFKDGTRCVVAHDPEGGGNAPAISCQFSTPSEKLNRIPRR